MRSLERLDRGRAARQTRAMAQDPVGRAEEDEYLAIERSSGISRIAGGLLPPVHASDE